MKSLIIAAVATLCIAVAPAVAADTVDGPEVNWKLSLWGKPRAFTAGIDKFSELVSERTGGRFKIEVVYGGQLASPRENLDGLQIGAFESAVLAAAFHPGKMPLSLGLDLPFLPVPDLETRQKVVEAYFAHPAMKEELKNLGVRHLYTVLAPQFEFMGGGEPPETLDDWNGKRVRALAGIGEAMAILGAVPISISPTEVYTGLERGTVDAASFPFSYAHGAYGLHEISNWYTSNLNPGVTHAQLLVSLGAYGALPEQYRKVLEEVKAEAYAFNIQAMADADAKWIPLFKEAGLKDVTYTDEERQQWIDSAAKPVWTNWLKEGADAGKPSQELLDLILTTAKQ
ncbi:TRAP transporter substrate-binding protein DctP [Hoeflea prorocentri]|uniref:TRAP transporter substrate-binding protein DctP n=1 Tax=Hoeflea prorocentri TaxID=1922333 RepID=A0A9X3UF51_9HYPH|nr:TRAP transporter substrate-binding protein DctP [Hoeflea prorocentri]MCY6379399.1 TRAP transporter substrate-binding protein DctP [Hoeflea prorocentri]MDA5397200.1 TRAP transporter substrate-binding protein DctP [Hoeflea prorocentri]